MDEFERRAILEEAWANVADLEQRRAALADAPQQDPLSEDALQRWRDQRPPPAPPRPRSEPSEAELMRQRSEQWEQWAQAIVKEHLDAERALMTEAIGEALATIRHQLREEIAKQIGELRGDFTLARAHDDGKVLDLPSPLLRRRNDTA
jgi:hypothetical protein